MKLLNNIVASNIYLILLLETLLLFTSMTSWYIEKKSEGAFRASVPNFQSGEWQGPLMDSIGCESSIFYGIYTITLSEHFSLHWWKGCLKCI